MEEHLIEQARAQLSAIPRLDFGYYPTPIEEMPRLRAALGGGPRLLVKRDDYTGPGFGGNKVRKLEYLLAAALAEGADTVITTGGEKSNHARVTAALAARCGLRSVLVLNAPASAEGERLKAASLWLDELYGAEIHRVERREDRAPEMERIAERLQLAGRRAFEIPLGASIPLGALGYLRAAEEATSQLAALDASPDYIFHSSSSGGTQAGLLAGVQIFPIQTQIVGVSPDDPAASIAETVGSIVRGLGELLSLPEGALDDRATVLEEYIGPGYGIASPEAEEAIEILARAEGIVLDPVYTAKAMAALIDWIRKGRIGEQETVLFWHTGGQLALFYSAEC